MNGSSYAQKRTHNRPSNLTLSHFIFSTYPELIPSNSPSCTLSSSNSSSSHSPRNNQRRKNHDNRGTYGFNNAKSGDRLPHSHYHSQDSTNATAKKNHGYHQRGEGNPPSSNSRGTQTSSDRMSLNGSLSPPRHDKLHIHSPRAALMSIVMHYAKKQAITKEIETALMHYLYTQKSKVAEDVCTMEEDNQVLALKAIAAKFPYDLKCSKDQSSSPNEQPKSLLQQSIEEELGPGVPYLITGPDIWNRLDLDTTGLFAKYLIYTNTVEKEVPSKGLRFRRVNFDLPTSPDKEWFVVDMCNNIKACDITLQEFTSKLRRLAADGKFDHALLRKYAKAFGSEATNDIIEDALHCYVHQTEGFAEWVRDTAAQHKARDVMILRDYLITHVLYSLQRAGKEVFLKGGCGLSLGYHLISRTSEDVDLRIEPSALDIWDIGSEEAEIDRTHYFLQLIDSMHVEDGEVKLHLTKCKTTQAVYHITFNFPRIHPSPITIVLEVMHKVAPFYVPCKISSKLHEYVKTLPDQLEKFKVNYDFEVECVHPLQTLYEKIHAVHQNFYKFQRSPDHNLNAPKWIRHLGDAYSIIQNSTAPLPPGWTINRLQEALARSGDFVTDLFPNHPALSLVNLTEDEKTQIESAYEKHVQDAYYGDTLPPSLPEVCKTIANWLQEHPREFVWARKFRTNGVTMVDNSRISKPFKSKTWINNNLNNNHNNHSSSNLNDNNSSNKRKQSKSPPDQPQISKICNCNAYHPNSNCNPNPASNFESNKPYASEDTTDEEDDEDVSSGSEQEDTSTTKCR